jgi:cytoskeletal protein CcmA (bactofilin family)
MAWGKRIEPVQTPAPSAGEFAAPQPEPELSTNRGTADETASHCVGRSVQIKGELTGDEDVLIDGRFEGKIRLTDHRLVVGRTGRVQAEIEAHDVVVEGQVVGDVTASDRLVITATGSVSGNVRAGRLVLVEGGLLKGSVEMEVPVIEPAKSKAASPSPSPASSPLPTSHPSPASPAHSAPPSPVKSSPASPAHSSPPAPPKTSPVAPATIAEPRDEGSFENAFPTIFDEKS